MSRGLTSGQLAASAGVHRRVVPLVEALFASGTLRLALGPFDVAVGADTYIATGPLVTIKEFKEASTSTQGIEFTMTGLDASVIAIATAEPYRGKTIRLLKAFLDADTNQLIDTPKVASIWRMKSMGISEKNDECVVSLLAEHFEAELKRAAPIRFNNADQQRLYPGDRGAEYVEASSEKKLIWPTLEAMKQ